MAKTKDEVLVGTVGNDNLAGGNGDDLLTGLAGDDKLIGGSGYDIAVFSGDIRDYHFASTPQKSSGNGKSKQKSSGSSAHNLDKKLSVTGPDGNDELVHIEQADFDNFTLYLSGQNNAPLVEDKSASQFEDAPNKSVFSMAGAWDYEGDVLSLIDVDASEYAGITSFNASTGEISFDISGEYQFLAAGETSTANIEFTLSDGISSVSRDISMTVIGVNDTPTVAAALSTTSNEDAVAFDVDLLEGATDVDATDVLSVDADSLEQLTGRSHVWNLSGNTLTVDPSAYSDLADGESETLQFSFSIIDGKGGAVPQSLEVTVEGRNDAPVITSEPATVDLTESISPQGNLDTTGEITFSDLDLSDTHSITSIAKAADALGTVTANVSTDSTNTGTGGVVSWQYSVPASGIEFLAKGEVLQESFTLTLDDDNGGIATETIDVTITGTNDAPVLSAGGDTGQVIEMVTAAGNISDSGTIGFSDVDLKDSHSVESVVAPAQALGSLSATIASDSTGIGTGGALSWDYQVPAAAVEYLAAGETKVESFVVKIGDGEGGTAERAVEVTITGTNDKPTVSNRSASLGEDESGVVISLNATDLDVSDEHTYSVIGQPRDASGNLLGNVVNNQDGTFTFQPGDDFQFLNDGESLEVSFEYVAIDDSGAANSTSDARTVSMLILGEDDGPITVSNTLNFESQNQNTLGPNAIDINAREFFGVEFGKWSDGTAVKIVQNLFSGFDTAAGVVPGLTLIAQAPGKVGIEPFFSVSGGSVDSSIPVNIDFTVPQQIRSGESFEIGTAYNVSQFSEFQTEGLELSFGMDLILEVDLQVGFAIMDGEGDAKYHEAVNFSMNSRENLFEFTAGDEALNVPLGIGPIGLSDSSLTINIPEILTVGSVDDSGYETGTTLDSQGSEDIVEVKLDLDQAITKLTKIPLLGIKVQDLPGLDFWGINFLTVENFNVQLVDVDFLTTLSMIEDYSLDINELPMKLTLEDGNVITELASGGQLYVGDTITVPEDAVDTNGNGFIDFSVDVDMDAVFSNLTSLGLSMDMFLGILAADFEVTSSFFDDFNVSVFGGNPFGTDFIDDGRHFAVSDNLNLYEDENVATLVAKEFNLGGFETIELVGQVSIIDLA